VACRRWKKVTNATDIQLDLYLKQTELTSPGISARKVSYWRIDKWGKNGKPSWNILASEEERHTVFLMEPGFGVWFLGFSSYLSSGSISKLNKGQIF